MDKLHFAIRKNAITGKTSGVINLERSKCLEQSSDITFGEVFTPEKASADKIFRFPVLTWQNNSLLTFVQDVPLIIFLPSADRLLQSRSGSQAEKSAQREKIRKLSKVFKAKSLAWQLNLCTCVEFKIMLARDRVKSSKTQNKSVKNCRQQF